MLQTDDGCTEKIFDILSHYERETKILSNDYVAALHRALCFFKCELPFEGQHRDRLYSSMENYDETSIFY